VSIEAAFSRSPDLRGSFFSVFLLLTRGFLRISGAQKELLRNVSRLNQKKIKKFTK